MAELSDLATVDDNNTARFPENQLAPTINDNMRKVEGMLARHFRDTSFQVATLGTGSAYQLTSFRTITALTAGLEFKCLAHTACAGGATTLQLNALTAKPLVRWDGTDLVLGDIIQHQPLHIVYIPGTDKFHIYGLNG